MYGPAKLLELRSGERVDEAGLGHDKQEYLCAGEGRKLIGLKDATREKETLRTRWGTTKEERGTNLLHDTRLSF